MSGFQSNAFQDNAFQIAGGGNVTSTDAARDGLSISDVAVGSSALSDATSGNVTVLDD